MRKRRIIDTNNSVEMPDEYVKIMVAEINKRRPKWTLVSMDFDDVAQEISMRVIRKYHTFKPERGEFVKWCSKVVIHTFWNVLRDNYLKYSKPCIKGCKYNIGCGQCSLNKSGLQSRECKDYKQWEDTRIEQFNINQTLPYENHVAEIENKITHESNIDIQLDYLNSEMKKRLKPKEWKIYNEIFIVNNGKPIKEDTIKSYKITYQKFAKLRLYFKSIAKKILEEKNK